MQFEFKSRFNAEVIFTQTIPDGTEEKLQCKVALELAVKSGANLVRANLVRANLVRANLVGANLDGANLVGANLYGANLYGANLDGANGLNAFKTDLIAEILKLPNELEKLRDTLIAGKIDGSTYSGDCACLAGTFAKQCGTESGKDIKVNGFSFKADASSPREVFFRAISPGNTPENNAAAKLALEWIDEAIAIRDHIRKVA